MPTRKAAPKRAPPKKAAKPAPKPAKPVTVQAKGSKATGFHLLHVHLPNERGALARLAGALAEASVNLEGFVANQGGVQLLTRDLKAAKHALDANAYHFQAREVREVILPERPGSLAGLCERLAWDWASIDAGFGLATGKKAKVYLEVHEEPPRTW
ncbi:MAG: domain pair [Thermoplasmata archaeon]|nr:domain pair [Thermoplasmata archaeon]